MFHHELKKQPLTSHSKYRIQKPIVKHIMVTMTERLILITRQAYVILLCFKELEPAFCRQRRTFVVLERSLCTAFVTVSNDSGTKRHSHHHDHNYDRDRCGDRQNHRHHRAYNYGSKEAGDSRKDIHGRGSGEGCSKGAWSWGCSIHGRGGLICCFIISAIEVADGRHTFR